MEDPRAPAVFHAAFHTSAGPFLIRALREWSPRGVDRLHRLILEGHYNDTRVYRMVPGWVAQFGYSGSPARQFAQTTIQDDPLSTAQNRRGVLSFSAAYTASMDHATNRTTELFINLADHHGQLDALGFTPVATVLANGMTDVVDQFYAGYGELADACDLHGFRPCNGPREASILSQGNAFLDREFPALTRIHGAAIIAEADSLRAGHALSVESDEAQLPAGARVQLHCHLDGSIPPDALLRIARRRNLVLPGLGGRVPEDVDDIWTALRSMGAIWRWFDLVNEVIGCDEAALAEVARAFVGRMAEEGVAYAEVRWDPIRPSRSRLANTSISVEAAVHAVATGLRQGIAQHPGVEVHQLLCAMRGSPGAACFELARLAANMRTGEPGGVVGIDLAGDEFHFNNSLNHVEACFRYAKRDLELNTTVHSGEMADDEYTDVSSAVQVMLADRIGHGYAAVQSPATLLMLMQRTDVHLEGMLRHAVPCLQFGPFKLALLLR